MAGMCTERCYKKLERGSKFSFVLQDRNNEADAKPRKPLDGFVSVSFISSETAYIHYSVLILLAR